MGKSVVRVNGRGGETMELSEGTLGFRTAGHTHEVKVEDVVEMDVMNAEDARAQIEGAPVNALGLWHYNGMPSSKGKCVYLVVRAPEICWVMEISKNQAPNAVRLAHQVCPKSAQEEEEEIKLYAAVQTPMAGLLTIGSIVCAVLAYVSGGLWSNPLLCLAFAGASIVMFVKSR